MEKLKTIDIAHQMSSVRVHIPQVERKAGIACVTENLTIGYPDKDVASQINIHIDRGQHVAVLGDNGQGKTTFLRTIVGELPQKAGSFRWPARPKIAYYAQHVFSALNPEDTVYSHLARESDQRVTSQDILAMAGSFLFKDNDVKKKVKVLSGGERARLVLAGLLLTKSEVLLLDEPTNHLDFQTVEALGAALKKFHGTVFFISHDRTFVNLVANTILDVKDESITRYPGTYEDYVYYLECIARHEKPPELKPLRTRRDKIHEDSEAREATGPQIDPQEKERRARIQKIKAKAKDKSQSQENRKSFASLPSGTLES